MQAAIIALGIPLAASVTCYALALWVFVSGVPEEVFKALADATLVASVLAAIGDLYVRLRNTQEAIHRGVQGAITEIFGVWAVSPEWLQIGVQRFANAHVHAMVVTWRVRLAWENRAAGILDVKMTIEKSSRVVSPNGYLPTEGIDVLASTGNFRSEHTSYSLQCPDAGINVNATGRDLTQYCRRKNGMIILQQDKLLSARLPERLWMEQDQAFNVSYSSRMYRHSSGYVPLIHPNFETLFIVEVSGPAVPDLKVSLFHPNSSDDSHRKLDNGHQPMHIEWRNVIPGQGTILSWRPASLDKKLQIIPAPPAEDQSGERPR